MSDPLQVENLPSAPEAVLWPSAGAGTATRVATATAGIMVFHLLRCLLGFIDRPVLAHYFGTTFVADAYAVARDAILRIWLVYEKVINPSFLPCFIHSLRNETEEHAWRFTSSVALLMSMLLALTTAGAYFWAPSLVDFYTRHPRPGEAALTVFLIRVMVFSLLLLGISSLTYVILNGYKRFALAALGDVLWRGSSLAALIFGVPYLLKRHHGSEGTAVLALAVGFLLGSAIKLLPHIFGLFRKLSLVRLSIFWNDPYLRKMSTLVPPLLFGILISEFRGVMMVRMANAPQIGEGGRAAFSLYARAPVDALLQPFPYAMSIGIFPFLAELHVLRNKQTFTDTFLGALRVCCFLFIPATMLFIIFREPIIRALFEGHGGRFGAHSVRLTLAPFTWFSAGMVFFAAEMVVNQTWYSTANTFVPNLVGVITSFLAVAFAWYAVERMAFGLGALALAETMSKSIKVVILILLLRHTLSDVRLRQQALFLLKVAASAALATAFCWGVFALSESVWTTAHDSPLIRIERLACVVFALGAGLLLHLLVSARLHVEEAHTVVGFLRGQMQRCSK